jgi:hypothetical protein
VVSFACTPVDFRRSLDLLIEGHRSNAVDGEDAAGAWPGGPGAHEWSSQCFAQDDAGSGGDVMGL